jgi:hypothetical protein
MVSYVDVGCATGDIVSELEKRGYDAWGIEGSSEAWEFRCTNHLYFRDLRLSFTLRKFDVCTCLEVAEHIEPEYADIFVENLCDLSDFLIVSAAPPGQGGHYHVNCQLFEYWESKFESKGFIFDGLKTDDWKLSLRPWKKKSGIKAFYKNSYIFRRKS